MKAKIFALTSKWEGFGNVIVEALSAGTTVICTNCIGGPKMILEKYKGKLPNGKVLPIISNQKLNAYLKEIADVCGIKKNLTFHLARHTFATTTTLAKGVPIETVSKMLGHSRIGTTQLYAKVTDNKIDTDTKALDKIIAERFSVVI